MWVLLIVNVGFTSIGVAGVEYEHEDPAPVFVACLSCFLSMVLIRLAWRSARGRHWREVFRSPSPGFTGVCGAALFIAAVELIKGSWGGNGVITDADLAQVYIGQTKTAVHEALGNPLQHIPASPSLQQWLKDGPGEDCDVYEKDPGFQGGLYAHVCYLNSKVTRVVPFL